MYALSFSFDLGPRAIGLTLRAALVAAGVIHSTFRDVTAGFHADGQGGYEFVTAAIPDGFRGVLVCYVGTVGMASALSGAVAIMARASVNPQEAENTEGKLTAAKIALLDNLLLITAGMLTLVSPVSLDGQSLVIVRGADYLVRDGLALGWSLPAGLDLTAAAVSLAIDGQSFPAIVDAPRSIKVELTRAQTTTLRASRDVAFQLNCVLANGDVLPPLVSGLARTG